MTTPETHRLDNSAFAPLADSDAPLDSLFDALSNERRRAVVSFLKSSDDDAVALSELVEHVVSHDEQILSDNEQTTACGADDGSDDRETVATALHHVHLPKLADAGLLDYDAGSNTVRFDRHPDREHRVALAVELLGRLP
ncbi:DUF7344 domain-containing protein [Halorussus litoreus]|uniref:DUF7344 domain-containing protein n=1 Tax=Halorussus litoreus TaxID=1710536 RepID=UPI000E25B941|nr:hypothetical protein [Halorussus litoreus]